MGYKTGMVVCAATKNEVEKKFSKNEHDEFMFENLDLSEEMLSKIAGECFIVSSEDEDGDLKLLGFPGTYPSEIFKRPPAKFVYAPLWYIQKNPHEFKVCSCGDHINLVKATSCFVDECECTNFYESESAVKESVENKIDFLTNYDRHLSIPEAVNTLYGVGETQPTIDDFEDRYEYDESIISCDDFLGELETYGDDIKKAVEIANTDPKRIWTMVDGDDGVYLIAGYHLVNRIKYIVTIEEWEDENESYIYDNFEGGES